MYRFLYLLVILVVFGCNKQVYIIFPENKPRLVVNSIFSSQNIIVLMVLQTLSYNSEKNDFVEDATCKLFCDDVFVENLIYSEQGIYKSTIILEEDKKYTIEISAHGFETVIANTIIPKTSSIISLDTIHTAIFDPNDGLGVYYTKGILSVIDDPQIQNFYLTKLSLVYPDGTIYNPITTYRSDEPIFTDDGLLNYKPSFLLFNDNTFNGRNNNLIFEYDFSLSFDDTLLLITTTKLITEDYYKYIKSTIIQTNNQGSLDNPFVIGEPIQVYSNIENGYGIFAGYNTYCDTIVINGWLGSNDL
ncbi:MAG: DUF4249 domain-containing protein [Bacteroidales bacterium]|nr:DUF4249 domain-containing protein [Bacteroidales bacterium]